MILSQKQMIFPDLKCKEHGIYDVMPCPWPNCKNGIPKAQFQIESIVEGVDPETYTRQHWKSVSGEEYYSWNGTRLPNWFNVAKVVSNEARRLKISYQGRVDSIYHYTTVEGFFGILESEQLWLSDYSYLNDTRELSHGTDLVAEVIRELLQNEDRESVINLFEHWLSKLTTPIHRVCIASFSSESDSLSQWRAYGQIAIGFKLRDLGIHAYGAQLEPVEYRKSNQRSLAQLYANHMREAYLADISNNRLERISDAYHQIDHFVRLSAYFKDASFSSEQEFRLAYIEDSKVMQSLGVNCATKRFRLSRGHIIPYVTSTELGMHMRNENSFRISEIILGPGTSQLLERGVKEFLAEKKMDDVEVKRSNVPYRT